MLSFTDQTGHTITLAKKPDRIISLVPSLTELLFDLGLNEEVAAITKFCVHPQQWFHSKTKIGGTKQLNTELIRQLQPGLIIASKEENVKEQVEELAVQFPVWISDINDLDSAYEMITQIGAMTGKERNALLLINRIKNNFAKLSFPAPKPRAAYLIWREPYMTVGGDTFIHAMMEAAGLENLFAGRPRYPEITIEDLQNERCELLILSSEPFPFKQKHADELQPFLPDTIIVLADGEMFSWYGSRLAEAPAYFTRWRNQFV